MNHLLPVINHHDTKRNPFHQFIDKRNLAGINKRIGLELLFKITVFTLQRGNLLLQIFNLLQQIFLVPGNAQVREPFSKFSSTLSLQ